MIDYTKKYNISSGVVNKASSSKSPRIITPTHINFEAIQPFFFYWIPLDQICKIFYYTMSFIQMSPLTCFYKCMNSPHPAANIYYCNDNDVSVTIFYDTPTIDGGPQLFISRNSKFTSIHPMMHTSAKSILGLF